MSRRGGSQGRHIARSALASFVMVPGREAISEQVREIPGVAEVLCANPTLTDLAWLSEAKFGVQYFCPDEGEYRFDAEQNQVVCSVHGNREQSRQESHPDRNASFARFIENLDELLVSLRFQGGALMTTVEIVRSGAAGKYARR